MINCRKKNRGDLAYVGLFILMLLVHMPWDVISDDAVNLELELSWADYFVRQWRENGRYFTDSLAYMFLKGPFLVWKVVDSLLYVLLAKMAAYLLGKDRFWDIVCCMMTALFPFEYMISAGYIATSANYMYPVLCIVLISACLKKLYVEERITLRQGICVILATMYSTNHEQTGVALTGGLICAAVCLGRRERVKKPVFAGILYGEMALALLCFGISFFSPGHLGRMQSVVEMEVWLPQYAQWSTAAKLYRGYTSTVAVLFFQRQDLVTVFVALLAALSFKRKAWAGMIPLIAVTAVKIIGYDRFVVFFPYSRGMPDIDFLENGMAPGIALALSAVIIGCTVWGLYRAVTNKGRLAVLYVLLFIAACTREMMGFSATIYASSFRTFTCSLFAVLMGNLVLIKEWMEEGENQLCRMYLVIGLTAGIWMGR